MDVNHLLILKVGSTLPALVSQRGDFEHWILSGMGLGEGDARVVDVCASAPLPAYEDVAGIVVTGSHAMVTAREDWSERLARWLPRAVERGIPLLGICYGHQLLAHALGGEVGENPHGYECGTVSVRWHQAAHADPLLGGLPNPARVQVCHRQSVLCLPPEAALLASSDREPHQAFVVGESAWGVQFHPEFDAQIVAAYIEHHREQLRREGQDPGRLIAGCEDTCCGPEILERFVELVHGWAAGWGAVVRLVGRVVRAGCAEGRALVSPEPLGFLGGVDPETGLVVEPGHPLAGERVAGRVLVFPTGKGSTVGSYTLYRLARSGLAPAAILNAEADPVVAVGAIIAEIPMVDRVDIVRIQTGDWVRVRDENVLVVRGE